MYLVSHVTLLIEDHVTLKEDFSHSNDKVGIHRDCCNGNIRFLICHLSSWVENCCGKSPTAT